MNIPYFQRSENKKVNWDNITRDERYFCSVLFHNLKFNQRSMLSLIKDGINNKKYNIEKLSKKNKEKLNFLKNIELKRFDIGFEVCFYRDMLYLYKDKRKEYETKNGKIKLPYKRTFDLALFSEDTIIIIEAKAQQGFDTKQLEDFKKDKKRIKKLFRIIKKKRPKVYIVGLHSSHYSPKTESKKYFDSLINWNDIAQKYPDSKELFGRANDIYPNKNTQF